VHSEFASHEFSDWCALHLMENFMISAMDASSNAESTVASLTEHVSP
jgi:hypothetical protein